MPRPRKPWSFPGGSMMNKRTGSALLRLVLMAVLVVPLAFSAGAASGPSKKPLSYDAYDGWRSIQGTELARDGQWLVYALTPQDGDGELVVLNLKTNTEYR